MSPRWPSVLCACVRPCFSPHKGVLLLYKWPDSHPRGDVGKTSAGWRRHEGGTATGCKCASESSWCAATVIRLLLIWTGTEDDSGREDFTTLDLTDCPLRRVAHDQCGPGAIDHSGAKVCFQDQVGCDSPSSSSSSMTSMFETLKFSQRPPDSGNLWKRTV